MEPFNWDCPYCGRSVTISDSRLIAESHIFNNGSRLGSVRFASVAIVCPNEECKEVTLKATLHQGYYPSKHGFTTTKLLMEWQLMPAERSKRFPPDIIPAVILGDYGEACAIRTLSPKASATLSRRALQGMIRDFWKISKARLKDEIDGIEQFVDPITWKAIHAVREIGNIGAHMEKDINLIVDVDPGEAELLIGLVETLLIEWYVHRHERETQMARLIAVSEDKKHTQRSLPAAAESNPTEPAP
jgi:Domain of unknown function (DUF4145)